MIIIVLFNISLQESRERMTELLDVDPKEEDFERREEFPGKAYDVFFVRATFKFFFTVLVVFW